MRQHAPTRLAFGTALFVAQHAGAQIPPLPEGNTGIASHYPGDLGIGSDGAVIFFDDFEGYTDPSGLPANWTAGVYWYVTLTTEPANVYAGRQALELKIPQQTAEVGSGVNRKVSPELDLLFLRWYAKIETNFDKIGSSHNGGGISSHYEDANGNATPGVPADGTNKYLITYECWRGDAATASPGQLNIYIYWPLQRSQWGDHIFPDGTIMPNTSQLGDFGPDFVARPMVIPDLGRWYAYEVMLQANTPGSSDGRVAMWLDGALIGDFPNMRLRDVPELTIDRFGISFHSNPGPDVTSRKWVDNVVAATSYIGPMLASPGGADSGSPPPPDGGPASNADPTPPQSADGSATPGSDAAGGPNLDAGALVSNGCACSTSMGKGYDAVALAVLFALLAFGNRRRRLSESK